MKSKTIYRITFHNQEKVYEIYARNVTQHELFGYIVVEDLVFGETSSLVVDPGQEKLKSEFHGVKRTFIPMHSVIRIDEVEKEGLAKITALGKESNISHFPSTIYSKPPENLN